MARRLTTWVTEMMKLETAIRQAIDGTAVLFLGSGASQGAQPLVGDNFLTGRELAAHLSRLANVVPPSEDLNFAAQKYRTKIGDSQLVALLQGLFSAKTVTDSHRRLSEIPWKAIYTTNYDNVIERAYADKKKKLVAITPDLDSREFTARANSVLHINGFIDTLTTEALNGSFKLTNTSYLTESFSKSNWSFLFRRSLETARSVIFVGYSMYDLDIQRILYAGEDLKAKTIFIERADKTREEIENSLQIDFGSIYPIGLEGFWREFDKIAPSHAPRDESETFFAFDEFNLPAQGGGALRDDDLFQLVLRGQVRTDMVWESINSHSPHRYYILRDQIPKSIQSIAGGARNIVGVSDLANGKTLFCLGLVCKLSAQGYRCFWLKEDVDNASAEIDRICGVAGNVAIIIENYSRRLDDIRQIQLKRSNNLVLILSGKTSIHEVYQSDLLEILAPGQSAEFDLNILSHLELQAVEELLSTYKLWGDRDAWSMERKRRFLTEECGRQLSGVLLDIVRSPAIQTRFHGLFESFHAKSQIVDVVVAASVLKLLGFDKPRESMISELLDSNYLYSLDFKRNPLAREILAFQGGGIIPRSSIVAKFGLTTFSDGRTLIDRLIKLATNAHDRGADSELYFGIYKDLVTFSILQSLLPEKGKRDSLIRFYEGLKNLRAAKNHPHFWLQYAIARLASDRPDDLRMAKLFLDTAYAHAQKRSNYHTRHMDNVLARYWIQHSLTVPEITSAMLELADGHALIIKQCRTDPNDSPYRVARLYLSFYNAKRNQLSVEHKNLLEKMASGILELIPRLPQHIQLHSTVRFCRGDLESLIADVQASRH
jgi:hypothetical protein